MATEFIDKARISVSAGKGGNGAVAFHREKYIAAGGPDGGDGGNGGDIILQVDDNMSTLMDFRYKRKYTAENGMDGQGSRKFGKSGKPLTIRSCATRRQTRSFRICPRPSLTSSVTAARAAGATATSPRPPVRCRALPRRACPARATTSFWSSSCSRTWG